MTDPWVMIVPPRAENHMDLADRIASRYRRSYPMMDWDDLRSEAYVGLLDAIEKFSPEGEARFASYAYHRISGHLMDFVRQQAKQGFSGSRGVPRSVRSLEEDSAWEGVVDRDPSVDWCLEYEDLVAKILRMVPNTTRLGQANRGRDAVRALLTRCDCTPMKAAGRSVGISESRVSHLINALREMLCNHPEFGPLARKIAEAPLAR